MDYTLAQLGAYAKGAAQVENEKLAALLNVITIGSRGDGKAVEKMVKALGG